MAIAWQKLKSQFTTSKAFYVPVPVATQSKA